MVNLKWSYPVYLLFPTLSYFLMHLKLLAIMHPLFNNLHFRSQAPPLAPPFAVIYQLFLTLRPLGVFAQAQRSLEYSRLRSSNHSPF